MVFSHNLPEQEVPALRSGTLLHRVGELHLEGTARSGKDERARKHVDYVRGHSIFRRPVVNVHRDREWGSGLDSFTAFSNKSTDMLLQRVDV